MTFNSANQYFLLGIRKFKVYSIIIHVLIWLFFLSIPLALISSHEIPSIVLHWFIIHFILLVMLFYLNFYVFIPQFFFKEKYLSYAISILIVVVAIVVIRYLISRLNMGLTLPDPLMSFERRPVNPMIKDLPPTLLTIFMTLGLSTSFALAQDYIKKERIKKVIENQRLHTELQFLRYQVSPHFFFNTLNSLYSLSLIKSPKTPESILKLSDLMRYMIYEANADYVSLEKEVNYIQSYIDLQRLRITDNVKLEFDVKGDIIGLKIAPMILITFIENAFKFGVDVSSKSIIKISLELQGSKLNMVVQNSISQKHEIGLDKSGSGLGLSNTTKRLALIYPDKHSLQISKQEFMHFVYININLS